MVCESLEWLIPVNKCWATVVITALLTRWPAHNVWESFNKGTLKANALRCIVPQEAASRLQPFTSVNLGATAWLFALTMFVQYMAKSWGRFMQWITRRVLLQICNDPLCLQTETDHLSNVSFALILTEHSILLAEHLPKKSKSRFDSIRQKPRNHKKDWECAVQCSRRLMETQKVLEGYHCTI